MKASQRFTFLVVCTILAISGLAVAQDPSGDPADRVARLQRVEGQVSLQPGGVDDWVDASLNRPLTTADRIWIDQGSRAELSIASAALRLGSETSLTVTNLNDNTAQFELDQGTLNLSVRYMNPGDVVEVDTPNFAYTVFRPGLYRFDVMPDQDQSWIQVRGGGDGEASGQNGVVRVSNGQRDQFSQGQSLAYVVSGLSAPDDFDGWCMDLERRETSSPSARYVAAGTIGYEDLDNNGYWEASPVYGSIWYPQVHPGWAPYREGHWAWVEPWGWTWVDDAPWGFAPFHYGRWVNAGGRWGWVPGPVGVRPVYAPALVAWVGGVSIGVGGGVGVAWVPLGWHDPFIPTYHVSPVYARNVNISNSRVVNVTVVNNYYTTTNVTVRNTTINNIHYENAQVNGAVTGVPSNAFASGRPVGKVGMAVPASAMARPNMMAGALVVPTREAVLGGHPPAQAPQHIVAPRPVASKIAPPQRPVSFDQQRPLLEKSNGVPLSPAVRSNLQKSAPPQPVRAVPPAVNPPAGRPPVANQPAGNQPFGRPAANAPVAPQPSAKPNVPPSSAPNQPNRPAVQSAPVNANQNNVPARNVPRPPQATGNANEQRTPPARPNEPAVRQDEAVKGTAPAATPTHPAITPAPPAHNAAPVPAPQHKNPPPPPKENKEKEKEKDPKGH